MKAYFFNQRAFWMETGQIYAKIMQFSTVNVQDLGT